MTATQTRRTLRVVREGGSRKVIVTAGRDCAAYAVEVVGGNVEWWNATARKLYTVVCRGGRAVGCDCDGFRFKGKCRHVAASNKLNDIGEVDLDGSPDGWLASVQ